VLGSDLLIDKVGTNMAEKEPKSTSGHSCLEPHERLNVIDSPKLWVLCRIDMLWKCLFKRVLYLPSRLKSP
jgi:hypothetical protein